MPKALAITLPTPGRERRNPSADRALDRHTVLDRRAGTTRTLYRLAAIRAIAKNDCTADMLQLLAKP